MVAAEVEVDDGAVDVVAEVVVEVEVEVMAAVAAVEVSPPMNTPIAVCTNHHLGFQSGGNQAPLGRNSRW
jgi:hypothetical protein